MEPLHPEFRAELKKAHPGLTDETIDRYEELLVQRFQLDPTRARETIERLDHERMQLVERAMPRYKEVWQRFQDKLKGKRPTGRP